MLTTSLEKRVAALESELQSVKKELKLLAGGKPKADWVDQVAGSMKDFPAFDEVMQIVRENRAAELVALDRAAKPNKRTRNTRQSRNKAPKRSASR